jgi:ATP-binding protein involved in chromosome partitioning
VWGELDYLLVDLPPGTGDIHLSVMHEIELDGAVIVSTPGRLAVADVERGVAMFRAEGISVPVLGIIENMAWFTPAELPDNRYFIFGRGEAEQFAGRVGIDFLGDIPIVLSADGGSEVALPASGVRKEGMAGYYSQIAARIVDKLSGQC